MRYHPFLTMRKRVTMHRSAHETEWLERNADFLSEVETLAVELLEDLEVDKKPYSRCVSDFTPNDRMP